MLIIIFSAINVNGERAYKLARQGKKVELSSRPVQVHELDITKKENTLLEVTCSVSSGTYIRSLARDIAEELGTAGHLITLRRTSIGEFSIENAKTLEEVKESDLISGFDALYWIKSITLDSEQKKIVEQGGWINSDKGDGYFKIECEGVFLGIGEICEKKLKAHRLLPINTEDR